MARGASPFTTSGTPSSEVTVLICRVPSQGITHAPRDSLPVYLCRFAVRSPTSLLRGFSWQLGVTHFQPEGLVFAPQSIGTTDLPTVPSYTLKPSLPIDGWAILLRHPIVITKLWRYRNVDLFPIDYAFRPRLRDRLTLSGLTFLRKP